MTASIPGYQIPTIDNPPVEQKKGRKPKTVEEMLPAVTDFVAIDPIPPIDDEMTEEQIKRQDVHTANQMLEVLHFSFGAARSIKSITSLVSCTMKTLEMRRRILIEHDRGDKNTARRPVLPLT